MRIRAAAVVAALLSAAACSSGSESPSVPEPVAPASTTASPSPAAEPTPSPTRAVVFPGVRWERQDEGDFASVDAALRTDGSTCVAVIKDGKLVHDAYWNGGAPQNQQRVYSIAKSLTSVLAGTFIDGGGLDLDARLGGAAGSVTVRDLLSMTSGRQWSEAIDRQLIRASTDQTAFATGLRQEREPGERWVYDNAAVQTLESVLDGLTSSDDVVELAQERLLGPLGMRDTSWGRDAAGNALTYSGMTSTCLDLARIGHLMLNEGRWRGEQVVPPGYVGQATTPSTALNAAYGLLWWTNAQGRIVEVLRQAGFATDKPPYEGRLAPNVPADAYWAFGYGNQYIAVVPSAGIVAVRLGARPSSPDRVTFDSFTAGVLAALR